MPKLTGTAIRSAIERCHQRAVDHHQPAEAQLHRIPILRPQEAEAELVYCRRRADDERDD